MSSSQPTSGSLLCESNVLTSLWRLLNAWEPCWMYLLLTKSQASFKLLESMHLQKRADFHSCKYNIVAGQRGLAYLLFSSTAVLRFMCPCYYVNAE